MSEKDSGNGFIEWVSEASVHADGFWNPNGAPSAEKGSNLQGILLMLRMTDAEGKKIKNPFYIFELTEDLTIDAFIDQKPVAKLPKGSRCGVSAWKMLAGITRRLGHEFRIQYKGKRRLPNGNLLVDVKFQYSRNMVKEVERQSQQLYNEGDEGKDSNG